MGWPSRCCGRRPYSRSPALVRSGPGATIAYEVRGAGDATPDSGAPRLGDTRFRFQDVFPETAERQEAVAFADALGDAQATQADLHEYLTMLFYSPEKRDAYLARYSPRDYRKDAGEETWKEPPSAGSSCAGCTGVDQYGARVLSPLALLLR